jgi:hypothetical protein
MGNPKAELLQQRLRKVAFMREAKAAFAEHMRQKRQLRQLFKVQPGRRRRMQAPEATRT